MHRFVRRIASALMVAWWCATATAADWPQYRGPDRTDVSRETGLLQAWPKGGPKLAWTYEDAGVGYSGVAVVGNRLYTMGARGDTEFLIALDLKDGAAPAQAYAAKLGPKFEFKSNSWSAGPSSTPTVDGDAIYALTGRGLLVCVASADGVEKWRVDLPTELGAEINPIGGGPPKLGWGFTWSPLVDGDRLIVAPGGPKGTLAALDKKTGKPIWRSVGLGEQASYASPVAAEIHGVKQYLALTNQGLTGVSAADGKPLWSWKGRLSTEVVNTPIVRGDLVFVSVGVANGCNIIKVSKDGDAFKAEAVHTSNNLANHHGGTLMVDGHIYGHANRAGWVCLDMADGKVLWSERAKLPGGSITCADNRLYCFTEGQGIAALVELSAEGFKEHGRLILPKKSAQRQPRGQIWTPPVVSGGMLYLRDQDLLFAYDIRAGK